MNEADRIAAQRAAERDRAAQDAVVQNQNHRREHIHRLIAQAKGLAPQVLRAKEMATPKYDGIENVGVSVYRKGLSASIFGYSRSMNKGGYRIQDYTYHSLGTANTGWIYLLTDGALSVSGIHETIDEYGEQVLLTEGFGNPKDKRLHQRLSQYQVSTFEKLVESMERQAKPKA
ncbi:hypothetical protein ACFT9M_28875 [Micromonospora purpureochromogenes]|uniref:hypothetical protein n=1 Tax=Micromonospora purpureochromogenes TaxID=47872 RepID=UPI00363C3C09